MAARRDLGERTSLLDPPVDGHAVLLQRIHDLEKQRDRWRSRFNHARTSCDYWRTRAKAAEFTPPRPDVARELSFLRRENARLAVRVDALRSCA